MPTFTRDDLELHYAERGDQDGEPVVLIHGLLFSYRLFERVAGSLPGYRVLLLDLHGHGKSSKPLDPRRYCWPELHADVAALLDHLGLERAVVGGLSLGANVTLTFAQAHPERCRALVLEMPVLRRGRRFARRAFTAMAATYATGHTGLGLTARALGRLPLPRRVPELAAFRDVASQEPAVVTAVLRGLLAEPPIPEDAAMLARLSMPALVIGHGRDPLHVLADARDLARRLPQARLVEAPSIAHYRLHPGELAAELRSFLDSLPPEP